MADIEATGLTRRRLLQGMTFGAAAISASALLAACGGDDDDDDDSNSSPTETSAGGGEATTAPEETEESGEAEETEETSDSPTSEPSEGSGGAGGGGGTLIVSVGALPGTADPNFDTSLFANPFYRIVYDTLVETDEGDPTPSLAESWEVIDDTTWEITLREGVVFHSGAPFNAEAVKWNLDHVLDEATQSLRVGRISKIESVEVVSDYVVRITTTTPWATMLKNLTYTAMLDPVDFEEKGQEEFNRAPSGTGPFRVTEWLQDERLTLEGFPDHWRGAPALDGIEFRLAPEESTRIASLEAGESHVAYAIPPEQISRLEGQGLTIATNPIGHAFIIVLRHNVGSPLDDVKVRQAINYAVDKDLIIEQLLGGVAVRLEGQLVGPDGFGFNPDVEAYPYDPDLARELLAEAGYPDGFSIVFEGSQGRYIKDREVEEAIAQQLAEVGIDVDLQILESGVWLDKWFGSTYAPLFDVAILYAPPMDLEAALPSFVPAASPIEAANDETLNELYAKQAAELDPDARLEILHEIAVHFREQAFALPVFQVPNIVGLASEASEIEFRSDYSFKDPLGITLQDQS